jgi:hypothetical protein
MVTAIWETHQTFDFWSLASVFRVGGWKKDGGKMVTVTW